MKGRQHLPQDPFEGRGARRTNRRVRIEAALAFAMAIVATGLIAAMWLQVLAPLGSQLGLR